MHRRGKCGEEGKGGEKSGASEIFHMRLADIYTRIIRAIVHKIVCSKLHTNPGFVFGSDRLRHTLQADSDRLRHTI